MDADPIYLAPQDYAITWPLLGGFIIFALIIWCVCIWLFTRTPDPQERGGSLPPSALTKLRRDALRRIDEIDSAVGGAESVVRPWLGVKGDTVSGDIARSLGLERPQGVVVTELYANGPGARAGLREGDVIIVPERRLFE